MAIVSIQRILNTNDRAVLDMEYRNIINNLKLGSIEADEEIISLYEELMNAISSKTLNQDISAKLHANYNQWEKKTITDNAFSMLRSFFGGDTDSNVAGTAAAAGLALTPAGALAIAGTFAASCMSEYIAWQNEKISEQLRRELDADLLKIEKEEREQYNSLQVRLLNSSWKLLRQYRLPDEYRIVQDEINDLFRAVNEPDGAKSLSMLRALEQEFRIYPPYWVYRANSAQKAGKVQEAAKCFEEFEKVWRPVLRNDPFRLEAGKYHLMEALKAGNPEEALRQLEIVRENTPRSDWADNLFAGVAYFVLGRKDEGIECVELNTNFSTETEISGMILTHMKEGRLDPDSLPEELRKITGLSALRYDIVISLAEEGNTEAQLLLGKMYAEGGVVSRDFGQSAKFYKMAADKGDETGIFALAGLYAQGGPNLKRDYAVAAKYYKILALKGNEPAILGLARLYSWGGYNLEEDCREAVNWYEKAAYEGSKTAQEALAKLYFDGGRNLKRSYYTSYVWCCVADMVEKSPVAGKIGVGAIAGTAGAVVLGTAFLPVAAVGYLVFDIFSDYSIKEQIEGAGIFNTAKLSDAEMASAQHEAEKISRQIIDRIRQRQQDSQQ